MRFTLKCSKWLFSPSPSAICASIFLLPPKCTGRHVGSSLFRPLIFFEWIALDVLFFTVLVRLVYVREVGNAARSTTTVEDTTQIELLQTGFG